MKCAREGYFCTLFTWIYVKSLYRVNLSISVVGIFFYFLLNNFCWIDEVLIIQIPSLWKNNINIKFCSQSESNVGILFSQLKWPLTLSSSHGQWLKIEKSFLQLVQIGVLNWMSRTVHGQYIKGKYQTAQWSFALRFVVCVQFTVLFKG